MLPITLRSVCTRLVNHAVEFLVDGVEDGHRLLDGVLGLVGTEHRSKSERRSQRRLHSIGTGNIPVGDQLRVLRTQVDQMTLQSLVRFALNNTSSACQPLQQ